MSAAWPPLGAGEELRICVVGCGGIARQAHAPALARYRRERTGARLSGCCDADPGRAHSFQKDFSFESCFTDWRAMADAIRPHAVVLLTAMEATADIAVGLLRRRIPILLEKPPGQNPSEARKIAAAAAQSGAPAVPAFNRRAMPLTRRLRQLLDGEGEIQSIHCQFFRVGRLEGDFAQTAIHGLDTVRYLAGCDFESATFSYHTPAGAGRGMSCVSLLGRMENGADALLSFLPSTGLTAERYTVCARDNTCFAELPVWDCPDSPGRLVHYRGDRRVLALSGDDLCESRELYMTNGFYEEDRRFLDFVRAGGIPPAGMKDALQSVELSERIRLQALRYEKQEGSGKTER